jgi:hypothetical protein
VSICIACLIFTPLTLFRDAYNRLVGSMPDIIPLDPTPLHPNRPVNVLHPSPIPGLPALTSLSVPSLCPPPQARDYPSIQFWKRATYSASTTSKKSIAKPFADISEPEKPTSLSWIEEEDGRIIDGDRADSIRRHLRGIFTDLSRYGAAPDVWGDAGREAIAYTQYHMYTKFPILRLCSDNWKLSCLISRVYSNWHRDHLSQKAKTEEIDSLAVKKWKRNIALTATSKKTKLELIELSSTAIKSPSPTSTSGPSYNPEPPASDAVEVDFSLVDNTQGPLPTIPIDSQVVIKNESTVSTLIYVAIYTHTCNDFPHLLEF